MSTLEVSNLNDGTKTVATTNLTNGSAKAHYEFSGVSASLRSGSTFNVSSLTDDSTGVFYINFTNAMSQEKSPVATSTSGSGVVNYGDHEAVMSTSSSILHRTYSTASAGLTDFNFNSGAAFGDLA